MHEFCCATLERLISAAGEAGIAVVVRNDGESFRFYLQSRAVPFQEQNRMREYEIDQRINLVTTLGIRYCPWCGSLLASIGNEARQRFTATASKHVPFIGGP